MDPMTQGQIKDWFTMICIFGLFGFAAYVSGAALRRGMKNQMQKHMLDKFSSAQDFAAFMQSPAGQKYLSNFSETVTDSRQTILNSLRTGIILLFVGGGFSATSYGIGFAAKNWLDAAGNILIMTGAGFVVAAVVAHFVAKRMKIGEKE